MHPVTDTQSEDCHCGTELLCRRSKVGSKRRFCSAVLCVSVYDDSAHHALGSRNHFQPTFASVDAIRASQIVAEAPAAPMLGTVLKLKRREIEVKPDM